MNNMSDQYYSRLLAIARQNRGIKFIKDIQNDTIEAEMIDGSTQKLPWQEVFSYQNIINEQKVKTVEAV